MKNMKLLNQIRKLQGISQQDIAQKIGVGRTTVAQYEAGAPAIGAVKTKLLCDVLSMNEEFLSNRSNYPFKPGSFLRFYIKVLLHRFRPLTWLDLLCRHTEKLNILLLTRGKKGNIAVTCIKDDRDSVFLVFVEVPLLLMEVSSYLETYRDQNKVAKVEIAVKHLSDITLTDSLPDSLPLSQNPSFYLKDFSKKDIEDTIDKVFATTPPKKKTPEEEFIYQVAVTKEYVDVYGESTYVIRIPVETILRDVFKYLRYGEDDEYKAAIIENIAAFYHARILKDLSDSSYEKNLRKALNNFRIPKSARKNRKNQRTKKNRPRRKLVQPRSRINPYVNPPGVKNSEHPGSSG